MSPLSVSKMDPHTCCLTNLGNDFTTCCSPNGALCVLIHMRRTLQKLVGLTFLLVMNGFPFYAYKMFATKEEVIYAICTDKTEVARINPADPSNPAVTPNRKGYGSRGSVRN